jgi:hypothetical protein
MAAAKALRGTVFLRMNLGSLICLWPAAIWAEITAVGITTIAANPGIGIGTTSGIAKNISEVPKELPPIELTIFSTLNSVSFGLLVKISRRICEVRFFSDEGVFLAVGRVPFRVVFVVLVTATDLSSTAGFFTGLGRGATFFGLLPGLAGLGRVRGADALIGIYDD